jgi:hypothetical protein
MVRRGAALVMALLVGGSAWVASAATSATSAVGQDRRGGGAERVDVRVVPVPPTVTGPRFPWWSADGRRILFSGTPAGGRRVELLSVAPDGTRPACLTCGVAPAVTEPLLKPIAFGDNRRVMVRVGDQSPVSAARHAVLECAPAVTRCERAVLVPLVIPAAGDAVVVQDQREVRVAPDGRHVGFTQVRLASDGEQAMVAVVARLRRTATAYELDGARVVSTRGELKTFTPDGRAVLVMGFSPTPYEAANPDVVRVDLATGAESRVTHHPDYDEPVEVSPDGRWLALGSGRGSGLFETVSQVRRPPFLGVALDALVQALFVGHRPALLETWLVDPRAEARGEPGRRLSLDTDDAYDDRMLPSWRPDGTAVVFWEGRGTGFETDPTDTRIVVAELVDRRPLRVRRPARLAASPWAPPLAGYVPEAVPLPRSRPGRRSGTATVTAVRTPAAGGAPARLRVTVTYEDFSDDGVWVVDGTESADRRGSRTAYTADLRLSGRHSGYLRADAGISALGIEGRIESEVDGRRLTLPAPAARTAS